MKCILYVVGAVALLSSIVIAQDPPAKPETPANVLHETFEARDGEPPCALRKHAEGRAPEIKDGSLHLLSGDGGENNSAAFPLHVKGEHRQIKAEVVFALGKGGRGMSLMLLNTAHFAAAGAAFYLYKAKGFPDDPTPKEPEWDEPNLWGSFALALDTHNPPTDDPFNKWGNIHKREQRELSLHFDGREIANRFVAPDFVNGQACVLTLQVDFVTGGAEVTVSVGGQAIYDRHFIPHMLPYESRAAVGAFGPDGGTCAIDSVNVEWNRPAEASPGALTLQAFHSTWCQRGTVEREVDLLPAAVEFERAIMTLRLKPMVERDEWDRLGHVWIWDGDTRFELARILTPFMLWGASYEYVCDVTSFAHLLRGGRKIGVGLGGNVGNGFAFDLEFSYYRRPSDVAALPRVVGIVNVWNGNAHFNQADSVEKTFGKRAVMIPEGAKRALLRICVTGHGSLEFHPLARTIKIGANEYSDPLRTDDCYLNPWRPQFGTWKYDRAGWGPGSFGRVWEIDITEHLKPGEALQLEYSSEAYEAKDWAQHCIESQVIFLAG